MNGVYSAEINLIWRILEIFKIKNNYPFSQIWIATTKPLTKKERVTQMGKVVWGEMGMGRGRGKD